MIREAMPRKSSLVATAKDLFSERGCGGGSAVSLGVWEEFAGVDKVRVRRVLSRRRN